ncbi:MAG: acyltransferase [Gluconacetobacter diazotrophicus]|nr:acyltransferase [Gluconacetobacter diazotrophicus]
MPAPAPLPAFENARARAPGPDLVRSLAILCVLACHDGIVMGSWWGWSPPLHVQYLGFYGVALFFVLSGFLIGTVMLDLVDRDAPVSEWGVFLVRRWLRTLPAYYAWLLLVLLPLARFGPYGVTWDEARRVLPRFLSLTQNLWTGPVSGWFAVTWSLTVEEWFYALFPALFLLGRGCFLSRRTAFGATLGAFLVVPLVWRLSLPPTADWNEVTSKIVFCRLDSIGWGVAAAWAFRRWAFVGGRARWGLLAVGAALAAALWWQDRLPFRIGSPRFHRMADFDLCAIAFAACMPAAMRLRIPPALSAVTAAGRSISTLSYPLYLGHLPMVLLAGDLRARHGIGRWDAVAVAVVLTVGGAMLSWRLVERPMLGLRPRQNRVPERGAGFAGSRGADRPIVLVRGPGDRTGVVRSGS